MDFFERQDRARRNTKLLFVYFLAGVTSLILALYVAVMLIFAGVGSKQHRTVYYDDQPRTVWWNPQLFAGVAIGTLAVVAMGSLFKSLELSRGGKAVATMLGGELVNPITSEPDERKLLNVVEEMAIASGLPVPEVYVMRDEQGINAFAAGHTSSDAVVAVTQGCLKRLTRDELQGVIAHEFSHILNGDMRLNLRLMGIIFGILCLAVIGRVLLSVRSRSSKDKNPLPLLGFALFIIGWVGVFFGRLIQSAVSRQREFLADASAVQFTRNPAGLAGALKKIGGLGVGSRLSNPHASEASHMFFGNGMGNSFLHLMDTHPPLAERIRAIEPSFDGDFSSITLQEIETKLTRAERQPTSPFTAFPRTASGLAGLAPPVIAAQTVIPNIGNPTTAHLQYAEEMRHAIPSQLRAEAQEPLGATTLVYALLLSPDDSARKKQLTELSHSTSSAIAQETERRFAEAQSIATRAKLPLLDMAIPALKRLSPSQFQQFRNAKQTLIESDAEIDLFEYVLQKVVLRHLQPHFAQARKEVLQFYSLKPLMPDCAVLLSALARTGQTEPDKIERAFQQGAQPLSYATQVAITLLPAELCELSHVDQSLDRIGKAVPQIKKNLLNACALTVAADGLIQEMEAELLRAIADTLDCPMPPFVTPKPERLNQ